MADTIIVGSRAHTAIQIQEPMPEEFREKPGMAPTLRTAVLNGANHSELHSDMGVTRGVDPELFHAWLDEQKRVNSPIAGMVFELTDADLSDGEAVAYGFEPGLEAMKSEVGDAAAEGSTITHEGPVTSDEMAAHSDTPNDDTPRGDPDVVPVAHTEQPATAVTSEVAPEAKPEGNPS